MWALRRQYLTRQLAALRSRVAMLQGKKLTFDEESLALYDAVAPTRTEAEFEAVLAQLVGEAARRRPADRALRSVQAGIRHSEEPARSRVPGGDSRLPRRGCRALDLPLQERFTVEYVTDKSWSGYNWYQGNFRSLIQVNTDLPIYIDRAIDLACHEGYPGHHVYNALLEKHLVKDRGWIEYTVYPLFSPQSLIAEGTANYGIEVAFALAGSHPLRARRAVSAGRPRSRAGRGVLHVLELVDRLSYAGNEAARRYIDGKIDRAGAVAWLEKYAMYTKPRAEQRVKFIEQYRSYVINYNLGKDLVRAYVERQDGPRQDRRCGAGANSRRCCRRRGCRRD